MPMEQTPHVLVVDDHREIRDLVGRFLKKEGFRVSEAGDGREMRKVMAASRFDLIILDLMLPGEDGLTLCREVRAKSAVPIIMLTAKGEEIDKVIGLEMGADDYLAKPFGTRELLARIKAVLRRTTALPGAPGAEKPSGFRFAGWRLDAARRELVGSDGVVTPLSTGEYDLLIAFIEHPHRVLTRDQLLDIARGRESVAFDRSIDTQVSRLRRKIERDPRNPEIIKTVWGGGYTFTPEIEAD